MSRIFLDTNLFIYLMENNGPLGKSTVELIRRIEKRNDDIVTSAMTYGEVLVKPIAENNFQLITQYQTFFDSGVVEVISFDQRVAKAYATVRGDLAIKPPDAIQLACASATSCDLFVTNDDRLSRKIVPGIQFITSLERVPI